VICDVNFTMFWSRRFPAISHRMSLSPPITNVSGLPLALTHHCSCRPYSVDFDDDGTTVFPSFQSGSRWEFGRSRWSFVFKEYNRTVEATSPLATLQSASIGLHIFNSTPLTAGS
jgi:hypothetical protein